MSLTYASLRLTNTFTGASVEAQALVDSGDGYRQGGVRARSRADGGG